MKTIVYSAPAKIILSGEHAVVYGKPGLIAALDLRIKFSIWKSRATKKDIDPNVVTMAKIVKDYLKKNNIRFTDGEFGYEIVSDIPVKQRLGSSGAFSVVGVASLLDFYTGREWSKETINNVAYLMEKVFHINASGVDPSTSCFGGLVYYRKEFEFLKTISSMNFKIPKIIDDNLYIIDSGNPQEKTGEMVQMVGKKYNKNPALIENVLNDIEKTTKRMAVSIIKKDVQFFAQCVIDNQILLDMLGVVSKSTKNLLKQLEPFGVGKVTGGGGVKTGSGYLLFFTKNKKGLEKFLQDNKIKYFKFCQSYTGVKKES